jgi:hypothetical protein
MDSAFDSLPIMLHEPSACVHVNGSVINDCRDFLRNPYGLGSEYVIGADLVATFLEHGFKDVLFSDYIPPILKTSVFGLRPAERHQHDFADPFARSQPALRGERFQARIFVLGQFTGRVFPLGATKGSALALKRIGCVLADNLSPQKARILLMLALTKTSRAM